MKLILHLPSNIKKEVYYMLIIDSKDCESIDRALKKYKKKFDRAQTIKQLRKRKHFTKPSVQRREEILKAIYRQEIQAGKRESKR